METILLADMNAFYASVEQADNPELQGKPIIICGDPEKRHGITLAASVEAKKYGIKTPMPCWEAIHLCPDVQIVRPRMARYVEVSAQIVDIAKRYSPLVEPFSIDEVYIDTKGTERIWGSSLEAARLLREEIKQKTGVPCSIGIAPNKLLAKVCCDVEAKKHPTGIAVWSEKDIPDKLWCLSVGDLFGVGRKMERTFKNMGVTTIGSLAHYPVELLKKKFGVMGEVYFLSANGIDESPVSPQAHDDVKSIGHSITLPKDYYCWQETQIVLREIVEEVCSRTRRKGKMAKTVSLYVKGVDLVTSVQRSKSLSVFSNLANDIYPVVLWLFETHWGMEPVRAITVALSNLMEESALQLELFSDRLAERSLAYTLDNIRNRYGKTAVFKASSLEEGGIYHVRSGLIGGHKA